MPIYVYETIPQSEEEEAERFEVKQSMRDDALKVQPETGKPVRRIITGGLIIPRKLSNSVAAADDSDCCPTCH